MKTKRVHCDSFGWWRLHYAITRERYNACCVSGSPASSFARRNYFLIFDGKAVVTIQTDGTGEQLIASFENIPRVACSVVMVSHGGAEIGQGINTAVAQCVALEVGTSKMFFNCAMRSSASLSFCARLQLGIPIDMINVTENSTEKVPNSGITGASLTTESSVCVSHECVRSDLHSYER